MRSLVVVLFVMTFHAFVAGGPMHPKALQAQDPFEISVREVTPGVYLAYRPDPFRTPVEGNATIIVNEADVVVVEGGGVQLSAERVIARIREITDKPC